MLAAFTVHIVTISMGLPILYFKGSQIEFSKLCYISVYDGCFNLSTIADPDEMQHDVMLHFISDDLGLHWLQKFPRIQRV